MKARKNQPNPTPMERTWGSAMHGPELRMLLVVLLVLGRDGIHAAVPNVIGWGTNNDSQITVPPGATNVVAIAAGVRHSLALRADGSIIGWGSNFGGAIAPPPEATNGIAVAAGWDQSLALKADGSVVAWGYWVNLGQPPTQATNVIGISHGWEVSVALRADGSVVSWAGDYIMNVPPEATNVVGIAAGQSHSLAVRADGSVVGWFDYAAPFSVPAAATNVVAVAAGLSHSLALRADGTVVSWGDNSYGQTNVPAKATNLVAIAAGGYQSLALKADGTVVGWGDNRGGQTNVPPTATNVIGIAAGQSHNLALLGSGAPTLTVRPFSRTVTNGAAVTLVGMAAGTLPLKYTWQLNGVNIPGGTTNVFTIPFFYTWDSGTYSVVVSNDLGVMAASATVSTGDDSDHDGISDSWEARYGLNPLVNDAGDSLTSDGLSNLEVYQFNTTNHAGITLDPRNPFSNPMGSSGVSDYEFLHGARGTHYTYDRNDRLVGAEYQNGTTVGYQYDGNGNLVRQMTFNRFQNFDGLPAMWKFQNGLNPTNSSGTNSIYGDASGRGWSNYQMWKAGLDPLDPNSVPGTNIVQSAPIASVLPQTNNVCVTVPVLARFWNAVGGSVLPRLQYQLPGSTNWQDALIAQADGAPYTYSFSNRIAALPSGSDHVLTWNASVMFTDNMSLTAQTNVLLRARAQAVTMMGNWSDPVNYTLVADAEDNGLPDAWELQYFGHTGVDANDDPDHDGFSNLQEYIADTNPLDSSSYLRITSAQVSTNGLRINWSGGIQAQQYLQRISSLGGTDTWIDIQTVQPPTTIQGSCMDGTATNRVSFYRIQVQRP